MNSIGKTILLLAFLVFYPGVGASSSSPSDPSTARLTRILGLIGKLHREHKKLENQFLQEDSVAETHGEARGYQQQHYGYGHGAITLDPVSIISLLALGAFLINNILQLLRANQNPPVTPPVGRQYPKLGKYGEHETAPSFVEFFENVGSLYYLNPKKRNICIKKVVCTYINAQQAREDIQVPFKTRIFDFMLSTITRFVAPELNPIAKSQEDEALCSKFNNLCSDSVLQDAKVTIESKVYRQVSHFISGLAMNNLLSG